MESHDSYPCFHSRLCKTQRRRLTRPDGTSAGWLILNADHITFAAASPRIDPDDDSPSITVPQPR